MFKYFKVFSFRRSIAEFEDGVITSNTSYKENTLLLEISKYKDLMIKGADCSKDNVFFNNRAFNGISLTSKYKF